MHTTPQAHPAPTHRRSTVGAVLVGVALNGFFDGILLHQVLQWHHLLSGVDDPALKSVERTVLADGLFHALMYFIAIAGLWLLWGGRRKNAANASTTSAAPAGALPAWLLIGFGLWNCVDVVGFHWLAGIHRLRMDVAQPWLWDAGWLLALGALPLAVGMAMARRAAGPPAAGRAGHGLAGWAALAIATTAAGYVAARPPAGTQSVLAFYPPGMAGAQIMAGLGAVDARVLWVDGSGRLWALQLPEGRSSTLLHRHGAWLSARVAGLAACAAWMRPAPG